MKHLLVLTFLLMATIASAYQPQSLRAFTNRTGSTVHFYFEEIPIYVFNDNSVKVCTDRSPLESLVLLSPDNQLIPTTIAKKESHCIEVTGLNFQSAGGWTLVATLGNGEKARLAILVRPQHDW